MNSLLLSCLFLIPAADTNDYEAGALRALNAYRKMIGLDEVTLDAELSKGCRAHAHYLLQNFDLSYTGKLNVHDEDPTRPGFSPEGRQAARAAVIGQMVGTGNPLVSLDAWMASFYHRVPLLDPALTRIGVALVREPETQRWILVLDKARGLSRRRGATLVCYPAELQHRVPRCFSMGAPEVPNPIPNNGNSLQTGHPITVSVFQSTMPKIRQVTATLTDPYGKDVDFWLSWQEKPAVKSYGGNTICLIPKAPLAPNGAYQVTIKALINGQTWSRSWSFVTGKQ